MIASPDSAHLRTALALGRQALGTTWPNPTVGCVIVAADGRVVGRGVTGIGGRPHAEMQALAEAGERAAGGTAYVTLEPCAHDGATPSCARLLAEAALARAVIGTRDPDPRTDGSGAALLTAAGVTVTSGLHEDEARRLHAGHLRRVKSGRPHVTLKLAASLDGRIATSTGASQWLTGQVARGHGHLLRARHDAILVGAGTAVRDDPELTCRLPGLGNRSPVRIVMIGADTALPAGRLLSTLSRSPVWLLATAERRPDTADLQAAGMEVIDVAADSSGRPSLEQALGTLGARGVTSVLVEGGQTVATALLRDHLADTLVWYSTDAIVGSDGLAAVGGLTRTALSETRDFRTFRARRLGPDHVRFLERAA